MQRIGVAAMLFAMLGFAVFRLLRIDLPAKRKVVITYDSNLKDKIVKTTPEREVVADERYREMVDRLRAVETEMERGDEEGSLDDLRKLEVSAGGADSVDPGSPSVRYVYVEKSVKSVEQAVREGRKNDARQMLTSLLDEMDRRSGIR